MTDLGHLADQLISVEAGKGLKVGLFIGTDLTEAFVPREMVFGAEHESFAQLFDLNWCIIGMSKTPSKHVSVNRVIFVPTGSCNAVSFCCQNDAYD